jgi:lysozyme
MTPDKTCFDFIKSREGLKLTAYQDSAGIWTIGYGTIVYENNVPVKKGDVITQAKADQLIERDISIRSIKVNAMLAPAVVNQNQFNALVSFAYNAGMGALQNSTLLKLVKANPNNPAIRDSFMVWNKAHQNGKLVPIKGLTLRRAAEADMYFSPVNTMASTTPQAH